MLVWADDFDLSEFVKTGAIEAPKKKPMDPQLRANVDKYIDQYMATGRIVVEPQ